MSCAPCQAAAAAALNGGIQNYAVAPRVVNLNCEMTSVVLYQWRTVLQCLKTTGTFKLIGLTEQEINRYLGIIQSAINYPDDYCYFADRYQDFQSNILPLIITNVPSCIQ